MPDASDIKKFAKALKTGKTDITNALDQLFGSNPGRHKTDPKADVQTVVAWLRNAHALDSLIPEARSILGGLGVTEPELDHIDAWDHDQKDDVRARLVDAIDNGHAYHFFWELHRGTGEVTEVPPLGGGDIHFRSPRSNMQVPTGWTFGQMNVKVG